MISTFSGTLPAARKSTNGWVFAGDVYFSCLLLCLVNISSLS